MVSLLATISLDGWRETQLQLVDVSSFKGTRWFVVDGSGLGIVVDVEGSRICRNILQWHSKCRNFGVASTR